MQLEDKVSLITGGARMGEAIASALAARGSSIALFYNRSRERAETLVRTIESTGRRALALQTDVTNPDQIANAVNRVNEHFGRLDVLINMASDYTPHPLSELDASAWDKSLNVDARAAYLASLAAAPLMNKSGAGRIINFSDWLAKSGRPRYLSHLTYYTAKSAVIGLTEALALELAPQILVNAIAPGPILAPPEMSKEEEDAVIKSTPLARWGGVDEIVKAVLFLIETDFMTGECIRVDGGRHLK